MPSFFCLSRRDNTVLYEAELLSQARGFAEGCETPTRIVCEVDLFGSTEEFYQVAVIDESTGEVIVKGPIVNFLEITDAISSLKLVLLPIDTGTGKGVPA